MYPITEETTSSGDLEKVKKKKLENTNRFRFTQDYGYIQQPEALIFHEIHYVISFLLIPARLLF